MDGSEVWPDGLQHSLTAARRPSCFVDLPEHATADLQVSVQYLVYAIRATAKRARRSAEPAVRAYALGRSRVP